MLELSSENNPIDLVSVTSHLKTAKLLDSVGGSSYLAELVNNVPSTSNALYYAEIIKRNHHCAV